MSKKVFISAGHGGSNPGAVGNGFKEKDLNLSIALACGNYLKARGVEVQMSRTKDENDDLGQEIRESNAFNPDVTVSIHNNLFRQNPFWFLPHDCFDQFLRLRTECCWPKSFRFLR